MIVSPDPALAPRVEDSWLLRIDLVISIVQVGMGKGKNKNKK